MDLTEPFIVADLDGTLLHDGKTFEQRALSDYTIRTVDTLHRNHVPFVVATARPVSTGLDMVRRLHADACIYLNGALIDFHPATSDYAMLTGTKSAPNGQLLKIGFSSDYACEVCRSITHVIPDIEIGIVMDDVRYTNFDVSKYWKTQTWRFTDFADVPEGTADKIIIFPTNEQTPLLSTLLPDELSLNISEGSLWMLMDPHANKQYTMELLCDRWNIDLNNVVAFGDDIIDIDMMQRAGTGVAVANSNPKVLNIADEVCASNNDDGVAKWIEHRILIN
ncbi:HAD family hydrolase [Bifidobacterium animalis subsp. animalis MCC 1489]|nr:HAD family hydrolase [Bifidobacterium animalis subsp. animalis MCC 1489]